jgi:quinol-cytochrome oxidoreductase complex cytochrome b subunit
MGIQVVSGLLMASALIAGANYAFDSVEYIIETLIGGGMMRFVHANFCSGVFFAIIVHLGKGLWFSSSSKSNLWKSGLILLILTIRASFLRYVLPWGHISFWGATVITSLAGVLPYGNQLVIMIWGGFSLGTACLRRFFILHFLLPLLVIAVIFVHLILLHEYVSSSSVGMSRGYTFTG